MEKFKKLLKEKSDKLWAFLQTDKGIVVAVAGLGVILVILSVIFILIVRNNDAPVPPTTTDVVMTTASALTTTTTEPTTEPTTETTENTTVTEAEPFTLMNETSVGEISTAAPITETPVNPYQKETAEEFSASHGTETVTFAAPTLPPTTEPTTEMTTAEETTTASKWTMQDVMDGKCTMDEFLAQG